MKKYFYPLFFILSIFIFILMIVTFIITCRNNQLNDDIFGSAGDELFLFPFLIPFLIADVAILRKIRCLNCNNNNRSQKICSIIIIAVASIVIICVFSIMVLTLFSINQINTRGRFCCVDESKLLWYTVFG